MKHALLYLLFVSLFITSCGQDDDMFIPDPDPEDPITIDSVPLSLLNADIPELANLNELLDIKVAADGRVWMVGNININHTSRAIVAVFNPATNQWQSKIDTDYDSYRSLQTDHQDGFYILPGFRTNFLSHSLLHADANLNMTEEIFTDFVLHFAIDQQSGERWVSGYDTVYQILPTGEQIKYIIDEFASNNMTIPWLLASENGQIYGVTREEIFVFQAETGWGLHPENQLFSGGSGLVTAYNKSGDGEIAIAQWFADEQRGQVILLDQNGIETISNKPFFLLEDSSESIYISGLLSNEFGLFAAEHNGKEIRYRSSNQDTVLSIRPANSQLEWANAQMHFDLDANGGMWIAYRNQIAFVDKSFFL